MTPAETVMLYTDEAEGSEYFTLAGLDLAAAVEDGVMAVFFDAGHIIFNFGLPGDEPADPPFRSERVAVRTAKAGGASLLFELLLSNPADSRPIPGAVEYVLSDVLKNEEIVRGVVRLTEVDDGEITDYRRLCALLGTAAAVEALVDR